MSNRTPLISVITVTFNSAEQLKNTLLSLRAQIDADFEHIIIDGASTDDTAHVIAELSLEGSTIVSEPDEGIYDAMNKGRALARGQYLLYLNAGDRLHASSTLSHICRAIFENDYPGIVYGQTDIVDDDGNYLAPRHLTAPECLTFESFKRGMVVCHQSFVANHKIASDYNISMKFSADYDWCIRCLKRSWKNVYLDEVITDYLMEGATTRNRRKSLIERFRIMSKYYGLIPTILRHIGFAFRFAKRNRIERKLMK